jgi:hypothetical protein
MPAPRSSQTTLCLSGVSSCALCLWALKAIIRCLADVYSQASFDQLKSGFRNLQREVKDDRNATHNLIHTHASVFLASHSV